MRLSAISTRSPLGWTGRGIQRAALLLAVVFAANCVSGDRVSGPALGAGPGIPFAGTVSDPAVGVVAGGAEGAATGGKVFVSLQPDAYPDGMNATIRNRRTGTSVETLMLGGGFDPVAITASEGDTLDITIQSRLNAPITTVVRVPGRRPPIIVRTDPPPKKRDVPLNAMLRVVFSEPIDPTSLVEGSIAVTGAGGTIAGSLDVQPGTPWVAQFRPDAPLDPSTTYELVVNTQVRDLDGTALETGLQLTFTTEAAPAVPQSVGTLVFSEMGTIYTMRPDRTDLVGLTEGSDPSWSPDGTRIAFWRHFTVYVMDANGANVRSVGPGYQPTWSPDGTKLAYGCNGGICTSAIDGSARVVVTQHPLPDISPVNDLCIRDSDPTWSPDGSTIAFTRWPDAHVKISLDGALIGECLSLGVSLSFPFDFWTEVWMVRTDGSNLRPVRDAEGNVLTYGGWPAWSPDGAHLALYFVRGGKEGIGIVDANGLNFRSIADRTPRPFDFPALGLGGPDWSPDGTQIVAGSRAAMLILATDLYTELDAPGVNYVTEAYTKWSWRRR